MKTEPRRSIEWQHAQLTLLGRLVSHHVSFGGLDWLIKLRKRPGALGGAFQLGEQTNKDTANSPMLRFRVARARCCLSLHLPLAHD